MPLTEAQKQSQALALVLYHSLRRGLAALDEEELDEKRARTMLLVALELLPGMQPRSTDREHLILIEKSANADEKVRINIQDAVDSLQVVWRDFRALMAKDSDDRQD